MNGRQGRINIAAAALACIVLCVGSHSISARSIFGFGILRISQDGRAEIEIIDPTKLHIQFSRSFPSPDGWTFSPRFRGATSPGGKWIASVLFAPDQSRLMIHLLHVQTWQGHSIIEGYLMDNGRNIKWSPDSRYLAINIREREQDDVDLFIFDVMTGNLINLSNDNSEQRDIGWSLDSRYILAFSHPCLPDTSCSDTLEIYDVQSESRTNVVDLQAIPLLGTSACNPKISADRSYVSFVSNCGVGIISPHDFPNELYVWHLDRNEISALTDYTQGASLVSRAQYQHEWIDNHTLLAGVNYRLGSAPEQRELVLYHLDSDVKEVISTGIGGLFVSNLRTGEIAFHSAYLFDESKEERETELRFAIPTSSEGSADALHSELENTSINVAFACESAWPVGASHFAVSISTRDCNLFIEQIAFVDAATKRVSYFMVDTDASSHPFTIALGWLRI